MAEDPDRIREQIVETRERLGDTAEALAYKVDLRSRARERAAELAGSVRARTDGVVQAVRERIPSGSSGEPSAGAAGGGAGGLVRSIRERIPSGVRGRLPAATAGAVAAGLLAGLLIPLRRARRRR